MDSLLYKIKLYFISHWKGKLPLYIAFWFNFILVNIIFMLIEYLVVDMKSYPLSSDTSYSASNTPYSVIIIIFSTSIWQIVGLWRSARKYNSEKGNLVNWGSIVQLIIILNIITLLQSLVIAPLYLNVIKPNIGG